MKSYKKSLILFTPSTNKRSSYLRELVWHPSCEVDTVLIIYAVAVTAVCKNINIRNWLLTVVEVYNFLHFCRSAGSLSQWNIVIDNQSCYWQYNNGLYAGVDFVILVSMHKPFAVRNSDVHNCYFSVTVPNCYFPAVIRSFLSATRYLLLFIPASATVKQMLQMAVVTHRTTGDRGGGGRVAHVI